MYRAVVADDDKQSLDFFIQYMGKSGISFTGVTSVCELLEEIAVEGPPDVLITETRLPDRSAKDLFRTLWAECPNSLIVVITEDGSKETSERVRMQDIPIFYFALKPLSEEEIGHVLRDAISVLRKKKANIV